MPAFPRTFISTSQLSAELLQATIQLALNGKSDNWKRYRHALEDRVAALLFFNPSLRTRSSFQSGIARLGGSSVVLDPGSETWQIEFQDGKVMDEDKPEHIREVCKTLAGYFDLVCVRCFPQLKSWEQDKRDSIISAFEQHLKVPLISMESSLWHPCQALADAVTLHELFGGRPQGKNMVLSWAKHVKPIPMAVSNSVALMVAQLGMNLRLACPEGFELGGEVLSQVSAAAEQSGGTFSVMHSQPEAIKGADVVYVKSWTPPALVGKPSEERRRWDDLPAWMIDEKLMARSANAYFMDCLPERRNLIVTDGVIDSTRSVVEQQAANRMHAQNALMLRMLGVA